MTNQNANIDQTIISVIVMSFTQESYINQRLDRILEQRGYFTLEVIIGDDESTDGTTEVLQEYVQKYPDKLFLLPRQRKFRVCKRF